MVHSGFQRSCLIGIDALPHLAGSAVAAQILIEGNRRVDAEVIRSIVANAPADARSELMASGYFSDVTLGREPIMAGTAEVRRR